MGAEGGDAVSLPATTSKSSAVNTGSQDRSPCVVKSKARHDKQKSTWLSHSHTPLRMFCFPLHSVLVEVAALFVGAARRLLAEWRRNRAVRNLQYTEMVCKFLQKWLCQA